MELNAHDQIKIIELCNNLLYAYMGSHLNPDEIGNNILEQIRKFLSDRKLILS